MSSYQAIPKAKDLLDYTMLRTLPKDSDHGTKPRFPKNQTFGYCKALRDAALTILEKVQAANDIFFEAYYDDRLAALDVVLSKCELMLHLIDLALKRGYITPDQCHYWAEQVTAVKRPVFSWRKADGNRAAALREAKLTAEAARIADIMRQLK